MGGYRTSKVDDAYYDVLTVFDLDLTSTVSGELTGDFTVTFFWNDDEMLGVVFTIEEIGTTGTYALHVPAGFPSPGLWTVTVVVDYNGSTWRSLVEVREHDIDDIYSIIVMGGSGLETVIVEILDAANANVPVPDLLINVYNSTGDVLITYGRTNASGQLTLLLDADTYTLRMFKPGVSSDEESLVVTAGGGTFTFYVESIVVAPPANAALCRVFANFISQEGLPFEKFKLQVQNMFDPGGSAGLAVIDRVRSHETDVNGHVEFDLVRGLRVKVVFITTPLTRDFTVPDAPTANLLTLFGSATDTFSVVKR